MSIITRAFRDLLKADSGVAAIVGTKVFRGYAVDTKPPYIIITKVSDVPEHHMSAAAGLTVSRVQVDCIYGDEGDRDSAETLSTAVREALDGRPGGTMGNQNVVVRMCHLDSGPAEMDESSSDKDDDGVFRDMLEFLVAYTQSVPTFA